jgi:probable F420-dependent oxidoreductase
VKFGVWLPAVSPFSTGEVLDEVAELVEARGIDSLWVGEHVVLFDDYDSKYPYAPDGRIPAGGDSGILEPFSVLTYLAARTSRVRLGTAVLLLPQRNPLYTAKTAATLDFLSDGRLDLGIGVGWLREEFEAAGVDWANRGRRTDEYMDLLKTLWTDDPCSFEGEFYSVPECRMFPKPAQQNVPFHIGGETLPALRRVAQRADGWYTFNRLPEDLAEPLAELETMLAEQGRKRSDITVTVCSYFHGMTPELVERYAEAGVDQVAGMIFAMDKAGVEPALAGLDPSREMAARY